MLPEAGGLEPVSPGWPSVSALELTSGVEDHLRGFFRVPRSKKRQTEDDCHGNQRSLKGGSWNGKARISRHGAFEDQTRALAPVLHEPADLGEEAAVSDRECEIGQRLPLDDKGVVNLVVAEFEPANGDSHIPPVGEGFGNSGVSFAVIYSNSSDELLRRDFLLHRCLQMQRRRDESM